MKVHYGIRRYGAIILPAMFFLALVLVLSLWTRTPSSSASATVAATGSAAPSFTGIDQNGKTHRLSDYRGKWLVLYFFPKADTPGCTKEACSFRDGINHLRALGASVVGVSMDNRNDQEHFARKFHIPFPLLADHAGTIARAYGAAGGFLNLDHRYTFLINPKGIIVKRYLDVDPDRHAEQILTDLKALGAREISS
jgi:peroxiredoxin Q/BCP